MSKEILENNKLIAEFMGEELRARPEYQAYHKSWDWLMPVVEKINRMDEDRYSFFILPSDAHIDDNKNNQRIVEVSCKYDPEELIKSVYETVIEFINYLNKEEEKIKDINRDELISIFMQPASKNLGFFHKDGRNMSFEHLRFKESWDWLMPVVGKIQSMVEDPQDIDTLKEKVWSYGIEDVYLEVVDLIKDINNGDIDTV